MVSWGRALCSSLSGVCMCPFRLTGRWCQSCRYRMLFTAGDWKVFISEKTEQNQLTSRAAVDSGANVTLVWSSYTFKKPFLQLQFKDASVIGMRLQTCILSQVECFNFEDVIWEYLGGRLTSKCPVLLRMLSFQMELLLCKEKYFIIIWHERIKKDVANHIVMAK